jgi:polygalacturonase
MNSGAANSSSDCANTMAGCAYPICFHRCSQVFFPLLLGFLFISAGGLLAQDTRTVTEPTFPVTCTVYHAPLQSTANGPVIGSTQAQQDVESATETSALNKYLQGCAKNNPGQAVELALGTGASYNAFLLNPITIPSGISLIIDGGVTVFGSRDPANYQDTNSITNPSNIQCGTFGQFDPLMGCVALLSFTDSSGIYGYGVIDGQGNQPLLSGPNANLMSWWDLTAQKVVKNGTNQSSPNLIAAGNPKMSTTADDFYLYKITIRNPPFHTVNWGGNGLTVWGVKIQAPWNVVNTDGFDLHGTNGTLYDTIVSNGDDDIAFAINDAPTSNFTVNQFQIYGRDGITILGNSSKYPTSNLLFENITETADLPSVVGTTVNGVTESAMMAAPYMLQGYAQALPNATGDIHGFNIKPTPSTNGGNSSGAGASITNVMFKSACMQDIQKPLNIVPQQDYSTSLVPVVNDITYQDIHILAPTYQFPLIDHGGILASPAAPGAYQLFFEANPTQDGTGQFLAYFTLDNVVFDDLPNGVTPLTQITAEGARINAVTNLYPSPLSNLAAPYSNPPAKTTDPNKTTELILSDNSYTGNATNSLSGAYGCPSTMPFATGAFYLSVGSTPATGSATNLQSATITQGGAVTLNAVVQPIMSQVTRFVPGIYGASPGLLAVGSPALTNPVNFYEGPTLIGAAVLSANGTLASLVVKNISAGTHTYTAQYPPDAYYAAVNLGPVTVTAVPPAATTTMLAASSTTLTAGASLTLTATVAPPIGSTGTPTGAVTFLDGLTTLQTVNVASTGKATYTTSTLSVGSHSLTAQYGGDSNFASSTSSEVSVTVNSPTPADFSLSTGATSGTVTNAETAPVTLNVTPVNGFNSTIAFACSGLPAGVSCSFNPSTVAPSGSTPVSTTVTFAASSLTMLQGASAAVLALSLGGWLLAGARRRSQSLWLVIAFSTAVLGGISGCGGGNGTTVVSTITITAVSGNTSHSTTFTLTYVD